MLKTFTSKRFLFACSVGLLQAMAFLRWEWLPETPSGRMAAYAIGILIWYALSFLYIPSKANGI